MCFRCLFKPEQKPQEDTDDLPLKKEQRKSIIGQFGRHQRLLHERDSQIKSMKMNQSLQKMTQSKTLGNKNSDHSQESTNNNSSVNPELQSESQYAKSYDIAEIDTFSSNLSVKKTKLSDFEFIKVLGRGAFGKVVLVKKKTDLTTENYYAMKIMRKDEIEENQIRTYMQMEKVIMQSLNSPFIVKLHYAFQTPQKLYMVQNFMRGGELFFHLRRQFMFREELTIFYTAEIILALEYCHDHNIIYRDLKPENILLDDEGHLKLTDFGLSKRSNKTTYTFVGTAEYAAPEIYQGDGHYKEVDWYSLGCLVYEMMCGQVPFFDENPDLLNKMKLAKKLEFPQTFSDDMKDFITGLLEINPKKRLGYSGSYEIKQHQVFKGVDFEKVKNKEVTPPFKPRFNQLGDVKYFDTIFTEEELQETPGQTLINYQGFSYTHESHKPVLE